MVEQLRLSFDNTLNFCFNDSVIYINFDEHKDVLQKLHLLLG